MLQQLIIKVSGNSRKSKSLLLNFRCSKKESEFHEENFDTRLDTTQKTCVFYHQNGMDIDLLDIIPFGGRMWKCVGVVTKSFNSYFRSGYDWYTFKNKEAVSKLHENNLDVENVICAVYDEAALVYFWTSSPVD